VWGVVSNVVWRWSNGVTRSKVEVEVERGLLDISDIRRRFGGGGGGGGCPLLPAGELPTGNVARFTSGRLPLKALRAPSCGPVPQYKMLYCC
jgi:hypothetical protein